MNNEQLIEQIRAIPSFANYPDQIISWMEEIATRLSPTHLNEADRDQDILMITLCLLSKFDLSQATHTAIYAQVMEGSAPPSAVFGDLTENDRAFWTGGAGGVYGSIHLMLVEKAALSAPEMTRPFGLSLI